MCDAEVKSLLTKWNLEGLISVFEAQEICIESFLALDHEMIRELIPSIGKRAVFLKRFNMLTAVGTTEAIVGSNVPQCSTEANAFDLLDMPLLFSDCDSAELIELDVTEVTDPCPVQVTTEEIADNRPTRPTSTPSPKRTVPYPAPLPVLSSLLQSNIEKHNAGVSSSHNAFVRECGSFLLDLTENRPSPKDYHNYCKTLVVKYPMFRDPNSSDGCVTLSKQMSHFARNHRFRNKPTSTTPPPRKRHLYSSASTSKDAEETAETLIAPDVGTMDTSNSEVLNELAQLGASVKFSSHTKLLISKSYDLRRQWILQEEHTNGPYAVIDKYPYLQNSDVV